MLDIRAGVVVLACLIWIRPWTIALALGTVGLAYYLERIGLNPPGALRALRAYFAGRYRPALPHHKVREPIDFPVVACTVLIGAVIIVVANLVVDVLYSVIDPRVRLA